MQLNEVIRKSTGYLASKGLSSPRLDAEVLIASALKCSRVDLYLKFDCILDSSELSHCRELIKERGKGIPVSYLLGEKEFYGIPMFVGPGVLVPRPETEILVDVCLQWLERNCADSSQIVDLGTGSGCIAVSLLKNCPGSFVYAVDNHQSAMEYTTKNLQHHKLESQCRFIPKNAEDLAANDIPKAIDLIVSNPPYLADSDIEVEESVRKYEPHAALFAGDSGLEKIQAWAQLAKCLLRIQGFCAFEIGHDQSEQAKDIFSANGFGQITLSKDFAGFNRVISAIKN